MILGSKKPNLVKTPDHKQFLIKGVKQKWFDSWCALGHVVYTYCSYINVQKANVNHFNSDYYFIMRLHFLSIYDVLDLNPVRINSPSSPPI